MRRLFLAAALCLPGALAFAAWHSVQQGSISVAGHSIAFTTLANGTVGGSAIAGSGTYTGTAPSSISSATWGGGCSGSSTPAGFSASAGSWSATFTVPGSSGAGCTIAILDDLSDTATSPGVTISASGINLVAHTQIVGAANGGTSPPFNPTGATLLVANVSEYSGGTPHVTISDSSSNTWTCLTSQNATPQETLDTLCYVANPTTTSSQTVTIAGTGTFSTAQIAAFNGVRTLSPFDPGVQNGNKAGGPLTTIQPGSVTPSLANSLVVTGISFGAPAGAITVSGGGGYTQTDTQQYVASTTESGSLAYQIQTTATATNPTWTDGASASAASTTIAVFRP